MLMIPRLKSGVVQRRTWLFILGVVIGTLVMLISGLVLASRGTLFHPAFWRGWLGPLLSFGGGMAQLPIRNAVSDWGAYLLFTSELLVYLYFLVIPIKKSLRKILLPEDLVLGMIATYGLGTIMIFIGRSHPSNLFHPSVPFCILLTVVVAHAVTNITEKLKTAFPVAPFFHATMWIIPWTVAYLLLIAACSTWGGQCYPNLLHWVFNDLRVASPTDNFLFAEQRDVFLPENLQPVIQRFSAITDRITKLSDGGRNTVAVIDFAETHFLVKADLKPFFYYSPLMASLATREQVEIVEHQLANCPPDYVLIPDQAPMTTSPNLRATDTYGRLLAKVKENFTQIESVYDMAVFERR